jgi:tRNA G18 (ribose-2'-O)-methylase SpoU
MLMRKKSTAYLENNPFVLDGNKKTIPVCIWLDNVRSALNVGSAFRTADALGIEKIYLSGFTQQPPHKEILKTALGSTQTVSWEYIADEILFLKELKDQQWNILVAEQVEGSIWLQDFDFSKDEKYVIIFGNEVDGVQPLFLSLANAAVEIPQVGSKHSLNVSVSMGMILWEAFRKLL